MILFHIQYRYLISERTMGKGEIDEKRSDTYESTNYLTKSPSEASKMLEAALLQMDGILSGNSLFI